MFWIQALSSRVPRYRLALRQRHTKQTCARMQDPEILRQRAKVGVIPDNELEKNGTAREAIVEVALIDCQPFSEHVTAVRGTVENPMTSDEVMAKAKTLIALVKKEARLWSRKFLR